MITVLLEVKEKDVDTACDILRQNDLSNIEKQLLYKQNDYYNDQELDYIDDNHTHLVKFRIPEEKKNWLILAGLTFYANQE